MRLSPLLFASPLSGFYSQRSAHSWKELSEIIQHSRGASAEELTARQAPPSMQGSLPAQTITLPLDHKGTTNATFSNRFWLNATFYEPGGPVILYEAGQANGEYAAMVYLDESRAPSPVMRLASRYRGLAIAWENRFFGESFPSNSNKSFSTEWKYHTIQQALDDIVVFANSFANTTSSNATSPFETYAVHPSKTPWIGLPGANIAFLREKHPEIIFAGWSSSIWSRGQVLIPEYYTAIQSTLRANCSADWAAIRKYVDEQLADGSADARAKLRLGGDDEIQALMLPAQLTQGLNSSTDMFCDAFETLNGARAASSRGLVAELGIEDAYKAWADNVAPVFENYKRAQAIFDEQPGSDSWFYQTCVELGGFQVHDPENPNSFVSKFVDEDYIMEKCKKKFAADFLPERPRVEVLNDFGGWDINPSNFLFTDGELSPWRVVSPSWPKKEGTVRSASETVPKCNTRPPLDQYYGKVYPGASTAPDFMAEISRTFQFRPDEIALSDEILNTSVELFEKALDEWIPCFSKSPPGHLGDGRPVGSASRSFGELKLSGVVFSFIIVVASLC